MSIYEMHKKSGGCFHEERCFNCESLKEHRDSETGKIYQTCDKNDDPNELWSGGSTACRYYMNKDAAKGFRRKPGCA